MADTYSQIYIHIVHSTLGREPLISHEMKDELCRYITGIIRQRGQKMISINCVVDHIHYFIGLHPNVNVSDVVRDVKHFSSKFINEKHLCNCNFRWQDGFGAFSYSHSQIPVVSRYIEGQEEHHKRQSFHDEYIKMLEAFGIKYDPKYLLG